MAGRDEDRQWHSTRSYQKPRLIRREPQLAAVNLGRALVAQDAPDNQNGEQLALLLSLPSVRLRHDDTAFSRRNCWRTHGSVGCRGSHCWCCYS
jgi:hypothetical protein